MSGQGTSTSTSAKRRSTSSDAAKFSRTAGCSLSLTPLGTASRGRRPPRTASSCRYGRSTEVASFESWPAIAASTRLASSTLRAIGPSLSIVQHRAIAPCRLTRPYVGRRPVTPEYADGVRIDPDVSLPIANGTSPAPTAEPGPLDEPPLQKPVFQGLRPGPLNAASAWL